MKVTKLINSSGDARHWSPKDALQSCLEDKGLYPKILILELDKDTNGLFKIKKTIAKMEFTDMITLLEAVKSDALANAGF